MRLEYFQLIDRIVELRLQDFSIVAEANVPSESTVFEGHFPGKPLMPGVLLIESMAQTSGWLVVAATKFQRMPFLASVKEAKFRTFVEPGQKLIVSATLLHDGAGYAVTRAAIEMDGKPVCNAQITLRTVTFPNDDLREHMRKVAKLIQFPLEMVRDG